MLNLSHSLPHRPHVSPAWYIVPLATVIATVLMVLAVEAGTEAISDDAGAVGVVIAP